MYLDSYDRIERRLKIDKMVEEARVLSDEAIVHLSNGDLEAADDCHTRVKHLLEQARAELAELKADLGE